MLTRHAWPVVSPSSRAIEEAEQRWLEVHEALEAIGPIASP